MIFFVCVIRKYTCLLLLFSVCNIVENHFTRFLPKDNKNKTQRLVSIYQFTNVIESYTSIYIGMFYTVKSNHRPKKCPQHYSTIKMKENYNDDDKRYCLYTFFVFLFLELPYSSKTHTYL